jgi:hypothetical protein
MKYIVTVRTVDVHEVVIEANSREEAAALAIDADVTEPMEQYIDEIDLESDIEESSVR